MKKTALLPEQTKLADSIKVEQADGSVMLLLPNLETRTVSGPKRRRKARKT